MKETPVEIIPLENGCNVRFTFNDLMTLTLYVADMEQAQSVRDKILADPESLYSADVKKRAPKNLSLGRFYIEKQIIYMIYLKKQRRGAAK